MRFTLPFLMPAALGLSLATPALSAGEGEHALPTDAALPASLVLETVEGEPFDLGSLRGERTLIVTWASW